MEIDIRTLHGDYTDGQPVPSYLMSPFLITTDAPKMTVTVEHLDYPTDSTIFSNTYYAYANKVTIDGLDTIIEERMRAYDYCVSNFRVTATLADGTASTADYLILHCDYILPKPKEVGGILTMLGSQRIHRGSRFALPLRDVALGTATSITATIVGHASDGTRFNASGTFSPYWDFNQGHTYLGTVDNILRSALDAAGLTTATLDAVEYLTLTVGDASRTYYVVNDHEWLTFQFRNIFNAYEVVDIVGTVTTATEVSRSVAVASGVASHYDQSTLRTYEVETAAMPVDEALIIDQLLNSRTVELCPTDGRNPVTVLITDHTCEIDNDDTKLASIKFTFRFAEQRPHVEFGGDATLIASSGIFTQEYTEEYV